MEAVGGGEAKPVGGGAAFGAEGPTGTAPGAVILQAAVDAVRLARLQPDGVELGERQVLQVLPGLATVVAVVHAAVAAGDQVTGVGRVDPQGVMVGVDARSSVRAESLAAVLGNVQGDAGDVNAPAV